MLVDGTQEVVTMELLLLVLRWYRLLLLLLLLLDDSLHCAWLHRAALSLQSARSGRRLLLIVSLHGSGEPFGVLHGLLLWSDKLLDWLLGILLQLAKLLLLLLGIQYKLGEQRRSSIRSRGCLTLLLLLLIVLV